MTEQDGWAGIWCEYELMRLPRDEFDLTAQYGLIHARSALGVPPHSTTGIEIPGAATLDANPPATAATGRSDDGWVVPMIEKAGDG